MKNEYGNPIWKFTGFYGHPDSARRWESWALLQHLETLQPLPWLCAGDFNEILDNTDEEEANIRRESQINGFRTALEDCQLCDLGYTGSRFTWSNKRTMDPSLRTLGSCGGKYGMVFPFPFCYCKNCSSPDVRPLPYSDQLL